MSTAAQPSDTQPIISARGLTKRFGDFTAVDNVDVEVAGGAIFAFLGANGSGKTTTIRMLIGLLTPTQGSIIVAGVDVIQNPRRVRDAIGYMGQHVSLYRGLSLIENVEFYAGLHGLSAHEMNERWGAVRERFGLQQAETWHSDDLPAGLRQRAGLALATLHRPRVLFLDEPTAGVDVESRTLFWDLIREQKRAGVTVFVTTHFMEEADYCDMVSFIDSGHLVAHAEPETLRARYSDGYVVDCALAAGERAGAAAALAAAGWKPEVTDAGLRVRSAVFGDAALARLTKALGEAGLGRVQVTQPAMAEVFRRVILEGTPAATEPRP
ncbi:MAG: ABC transporter ATP-binding protein [Deltaproteobacteria bacterium]|nr:ABC transporter ATP-binding protein [Deltaproteobacteria bacterium]